MLKSNKIYSNIIIEEDGSASISWVPADSTRLHHNLNHISCYHGHCHQNLIQIFLHHMNSALIHSSLTDIAYIKFFGHNQIFTLSPYLKLLACDNCICYRACSFNYDLNTELVALTMIYLQARYHTQQTFVGPLHWLLLKTLPLCFLRLLNTFNITQQYFAQLSLNYRNEENIYQLDLMWTSYKCTTQVFVFHSVVYRRPQLQIYKQ